jgi:hypothetical protein
MSELSVQLGYGLKNLRRVKERETQRGSGWIGIVPIRQLSLVGLIFSHQSGGAAAVGLFAGTESTVGLTRGAPACAALVPAGQDSWSEEFNTEVLQDRLLQPS